MNFRINFALLLIIGLSIHLSCNQDSANSNQSGEGEIPHQEIDSTNMNTSTSPPPEAPDDGVAIEIKKEQTEKSPFKELGCCMDKVKRTKEKCCCDKVLEAYKKMREANDDRIAQLKQKDPIFGDCRRKMPDDFDKVDNPPSKEDDNEDLY